MKNFSDYENIEVSGDNTRLIFQIKNAKYVNTLYVSILKVFISHILSVNKYTIIWVSIQEDHWYTFEQGYFLNRPEPQYSKILTLETYPKLKNS